MSLTDLPDCPHPVQNINNGSHGLPVILFIRREHSFNLVNTFAYVRTIQAFVSYGLPDGRNHFLDRAEPVRYRGDGRCLQTVLADIGRNHLKISPVAVSLFAFKQVGIITNYYTIYLKFC